MKKLLLLSFLLVLGAIGTIAQRTLTGNVSDERGEPLIGANVVVQGTTTGTITDIDGNYRLTASANAEALIISYTGFATLTIPLTAENIYNVILREDIARLDDVVVVGYGTQLKSDVTGSISQIKGDAISNMGSPSFVQQLAGRASGVQIQNTTGILGAPPVIRIRGANSITSGTEPLIVVDGVPVFSGNTGGFTPANALGDINPNDIESYEILKDGAATAIYGSRAANGVILITTKKGQRGKAQFNYDMNIGVASPVKLFDLLGAEDFVTINNEKYANAGADPVAFLQETEGGGFVETDWQDLVFGSGLQQNHSFSVNGGTESTNYFFSFGFSDQEGIARTNSLKRYSLRANIEQKVNNWLTVGLVSGVTRQENTGPLAGSNNLSGNVFGTIRMHPNVLAFDPNHPTGYNIDAQNTRSLGRGANLDVISNGIPNQLFVLDNNPRESTSLRLLGNAFLNARLTDNLNFRTQIGLDGSFVDDMFFLDPRHGDGAGANGILSQAYSPANRWNWQNILSYDNSFNNIHNLNIVLVQEYQKQRTSFYQATVSNVSDRFFNENIITGTFATPTIAGGLQENGIASYMARANYNYDNKYYLSASIRRDALSSLPIDNRIGYFPGASFAYRLSREGFWDGALSDLFSDFRLRGSIAQTGNTNIGNYPYIGSYGSAPYGLQNGIAYSNFGNDQLKWEEQLKYDFGIDAGMWGGRLNVTLAYWVQDNDDIILQRPTPPSVGIPNNFVNENIGRVRSQGIEITLEAAVMRTNAFRWDASLNFSTQQNEVLRLVNGNDIVTDFNIIREGESIRSLYGYNYAGVNEVNGNPLYETYERFDDGSVLTVLVQTDITTGNTYEYDPGEPGDLSVLRALNPTRDRVILGSALPTWFGGFDNNFYFGGFDLNIFFRFSGGNVIMNRTRAELLNQGFNNNSTEILGRWQSPENPGDGQTPRMWLNRDQQVNLPNNATSRFVERGDFLRLQNISLGYSIPTHVLSRVNLAGVRIYVQAQNLLTFTPYTGLDPETSTNFSTMVGGNANTGFGFGEDFNGNPQQRIILAGVNLTF